MERGYPPVTVDEYLAAVPEDQRSALEKIRRVILDATDGITERIGYQVPMFEYHRRGLVGLSVSQQYCCLHLMSPPLARELADALGEGELVGCTVHFTADRPLSESTVRRIVRMRVAEVDAKSPVATAR